MTKRDCTEMRLLIQAGVDGELAAADCAGVEAHLEQCAECTVLQTQLIELAERMHRQVHRYTPANSLLAAVQARLAATAAPAGPHVQQVNDNRSDGWHRLPRPRLRSIASFGGGFALAACLALVVLLPQTSALPDEVVSDHIRALQPGHLMDVVSTDQHTVKPWFDGRLDFAPPFKDLKVGGFSLSGGRLDYIAGKPVAALIYQRGHHIIDLFVWPGSGRLAGGLTKGSRSGYNYVAWHGDGMDYWAVSDLAADDLADFAKLLQTN